MPVASFTEGPFSFSLQKELHRASGNPADGRCPEAKQGLKGAHVRNAEGPNWYPFVPGTMLSLSQIFVSMGWVDGWMASWLNGWMDESVNGLVDE